MNEYMLNPLFWICAMPITAIIASVAFVIFTSIINAFTGKWED